MSVFFGGASVLTAFMACHRCSPATYAIGAVYSVKPSPMVYWYSVPDKETFNKLIEMDEEEIPLEQILEYLDLRKAA